MTDEEIAARLREATRAFGEALSLAADHGIAVEVEMIDATKIEDSVTRLVPNLRAERVIRAKVIG